MDVPCVGYTTPAAATEKRLGVLKILVTGDDRSRDFARVNRPSVERGNDAHLIRLHALDLEQLRIHALHFRVLAGDDREQRGIDAIRAGGENADVKTGLVLGGRGGETCLVHAEARGLGGTDQLVLPRAGPQFAREYQSETRNVPSDSSVPFLRSVTYAEG